jgi:hypothetical protein
MAVMEVVALTSGGTVSTVQTSSVQEVVALTGARTVNIDNTSVQALEIVSRSIVANVVVSATEPGAPFEGQIWIDIS